jgi:hypothetical protein
MDKHPIETWDQLVHSILHPAVLLQSAPDTLDGYLVTTKELKEALRTQLLHDTLYNKTETEIELLVERYQTTIGTLLNLLFNHQHHESITHDQKQFYQQVAAQLEDINLFLKNNFARFFNTDLHLPFFLRLQEGNELKRQWEMIIKAIPGTESNSRLMNILERHITGVLHLKEGTQATYHQVAYLKNLIKEISDYFSTTTCQCTYASLTELLICWNFNDLAFISEVFTNIKTEMEDKGSAKCRLEFLKSCYKNVSQLLEINNVSFYATQPAAQKTILHWISQELAHHEWTTVAAETAAMNEGNKIQTSLTVPLLALFTRLFKEAGIYTNNNQTDILKSVSSHFTTPRQPEVSYGHLQTKYYQIDEGTKKKVSDLLIDMAQLCKTL